MTRLEKNQLDFINLRFGTFIHYNSATVQFRNTEISDWEYGVENFGQKRQFPFDEKLWAPSCPDTDAWAEAAKAAGCRFAALTAKHHEGFCLWPTDTTSHSVKSSAVSQDIVGSYLESFRKAGISAGIYFSILDLTHGISRNLPFTEEKRQLVFAQVKELLTRYGDIPFLIVDGWNAPWGGPPYSALRFESLDALVKSINPDCLLMNIGCSEGLAGTDVVFYENAAGQEAGDGFYGPGVSCNKLTGTWFHRDGDGKTPPTSAEWAVSKAALYYEHNINFMLNLSPDENGRLDENLVREFERVGRLMKYPPALTAIPEGWEKRDAGAFAAMK